MTAASLTYPRFEASWDRVVAAYFATTLSLALMMVAVVVPELSDRTELVEAGSYTQEFLYQSFWTVSTSAVGVAMFWMPVGALLYSKGFRNPFWYIAAGFVLLAVPIFVIAMVAMLNHPLQFPSLRGTDIAEMSAVAGLIGALAAAAGWRVAFRRLDRLDL
jgi:hypothetical protein